MLRYRADRRTLVYLGVTAALTVLNWQMDRVNPAVYAVTLFMFFTTAVISHNHNHLGIWRSKALNLFTSYVIAFFYGHPAVAWVPTHNQVHHKLNNGPGDSSRSPKWFQGNHLAALLVYPVLTNFEQTKDIKAFLKDLWKRDRPSFWSAASEYAVFFGSMAALLALDWRKALLLVVTPAISSRERSTPSSSTTAITRSITSSRACTGPSFPACMPSTRRGSIPRSYKSRGCGTWATRMGCARSRTPRLLCSPPTRRARRRVRERAPRDPLQPSCNERLSEERPQPHAARS